MTRNKTAYAYVLAPAPPLVTLGTVRALRFALNSNGLDYAHNSSANP